jgi:hypothetical protein
MILNQYSIYYFYQNVEPKTGKMGDTSPFNS